TSRELLGSISIRTVWLCTAARECADFGSAGVPPAVPRASRPRCLYVKVGAGRPHDSRRDGGATKTGATKSVHDGSSKMMRPPGGVIVRPQAGVDLRDDDLLVLGAEVINLFAEQRGGVDAVGPDFNFLPAVAGNHLVGVDGMFQLGRVAHDP